MSGLVPDEDEWGTTPLPAAVPAGVNRSVHWKIGLFLAGCIAALAAVLLRPAIRERLASRIERDLRAAEAALESEDAGQAVDSAQRALRKARKSNHGVGDALLLLGLARARQAEQSETGNEIVYYAAAAQNLREAARFKLAPHLHQKLKFHLAKCLHGTGQIAESIALLRDSIDDYPDGRVEALQRLTHAYLDPAHLDVDLAYRMNSELLQSPGLDRDALAQAWQLRSDLLIRLGRDDPMSDLELGTERGDAKWVAALVAASDDLHDRRFDAANDSLLAILKMKGLPQPIERRTWYLIGCCAKERGDSDAALRTFQQQVEWRYPNSAEARAAATHAGAILLSQGKTEQAIAALRRAVLATAPDDAALPLEGMPLPRVLAAAVDRLARDGNFEAAAELLDCYRQVGEARDADLLAAGLHHAWAQALREQAHALPPVDAAHHRYRSDELLRAAGNDLLRVVDSAPGDAESADMLWRAARLLADGKGYLAAVSALERLFESGVQGDRRANALALCCTLLESAGRPEQVREIANACVRQFPDHAATAQARYALARALIGFGDYRAAESHLKDILSARTPDIDPDLVSQSRLILGHLLHDQGRVEEAMRPIEDLLSAGNAQGDTAIQARLLLADCLRQRARRPAARLAESHSPQVKSHYRQRKESDLDRAMQVLSAVQDELAALEKINQLTAQHDEWLQQCRRNLAECLFETDRVDEAIEFYKRLAETYPASADWLDAQVQIANCHVRMNRIESARTVLRAAQHRLQQQSPDALEQARVGMSPERWKEWLDWVRQL